MTSFIYSKAKKEMTRLCIMLVLVIPMWLFAHPGIGIVKDSKGNIYYTDLHQVWKIRAGVKTIVVPDVHTHELYIDQNDNLFGEGGYYDSQTNKFYHYLWVLRSNGSIDTVIGMTQAYVRPDFSLAKDSDGNEFYLKRFIAPYTDTHHIYKKSPNGLETILATGNFNDVNWLHPQKDKRLLYVSKNCVYRVDSLGQIERLTDQLRNTHLAKAQDDVLVWGVWQDQAGNIYAAVFSDKTIRKIERGGHTSTIYQSDDGWAPLHGIFDDENTLWVLESSANNDVRVISAATVSINSVIPNHTNSKTRTYLIIGCIVLVGFILYLKRKKLSN